MNDKFLSLLGIARRAGRLSLGNDAATDSMRKGSARLIVYAHDLSENTLRGVLFAAEEEGVPVLDAGRSLDEISMAIGKRAGVIAVNDAGFAKKLRALQEQGAQSNGGNRI